MTMDGDIESLHGQYLSRTTRYKELLNIFLRISEPHITKDVLNELKEKYNEEIASLREKDRIKDLRGLLRILEKRDALRYDEIKPLAVIANEYVKDEPLKRAVNNYAAIIREEEPLGRINHYKFGEYCSSETESLIERLEGTIDRLTPKTDGLISMNDNEVLTLRLNVENLHAHNHFYFFNGHKRKYIVLLLMGSLVIILALIAFITINNVIVVSSGEPPRNGSAVRQNRSHMVTIYASETALPVVPYTPNFTGASSTRASGSEERVFHRVSENLGRHWRDVARFLGVKENEIDTIEQKSYLGTKEKAYEALCIFKSRCDPCNWKLELQRALEKARRKDLSEMVSEVWFSDN